MRHTGLQIHILAPLQVLDDAQTVRHRVLPHASHARPVLQGPDGLVPLVERVEGVALESVAAGETKE